MSNVQLAYLPYKRRDLMLDDENIDQYVSLEANAETTDYTSTEEKKSRKHGLLNWLKLRVCSLETFIPIGKGYFYISVLFEWSST